MEEKGRKRKSAKKIDSPIFESSEPLVDRDEQENLGENAAKNETKKKPSKNLNEKPTEELRRNVLQDPIAVVSSTQPRRPSNVQTKNVFKTNNPVTKKKEESSFVYILVLGFLCLIILLGYLSMSPSTLGGNVFDLIKPTFEKHLPKGNGYISSTDFAEQVTNSFRTKAPNKVLSLLAVGSDASELKNSISQFGNALCGNVAYLEGKDSNIKFVKDLMNYAKNSKNSDNSYACPIFLINTADISRENLDMLEQAFDDSQPMIRNPHDLASEDINPRQMVFFLLYETAEPNNSKEKLREAISKKWTGRFFQRIRGVIGLKSEADT